MVKSSSTSNLVRPRTTMQDSTQSFGLTGKQDAKRPTHRSVLVLSLLGTCMFLFILCACLVTVLVLIGRTLSTNTQLATGEVANANKYSSNSASADNIYLQSIRDFASKIIPSTSQSSIIDTSTSNSEEIFIENSSEINVIGNTTVRNMRAPKFSKIIEQLGWRLPSEIKPTLYNLLLHPDFKTKSFSGHVAIHLDVQKPISYVAVHSKLLSITKTKLVQNDESGEHNVEIANSFEYPEREYWVTELPKPLTIGQYVLSLTFNGSLTDRIVGFYQSSYNDTIKNATR